VSKLKIYHKYDIWANSGKESYDSSVEKGFIVLLFDTYLVSKNYRTKTNEYKENIEKFIINNITLFKEFFSITKKYSQILTPQFHDRDRSKYRELSAEYDEKLKAQRTMINLEVQKIFNKYENCVIAVMGYENLITAVYPRKLDENEFVTRIDYENNFPMGTPWALSYSVKAWGGSPVYELEGHKIDRSLNQDWWFYETNLKLVVVHKIKDEAGNYYGELELNFYKIDEYDTYFTPDGTPKKEAAGVFYQDQKKRYFEWLDKKGK
jgi:hypothetical protein